MGWGDDAGFWGEALAGSTRTPTRAAAVTTPRAYTIARRRWRSKAAIEQIARYAPTQAERVDENMMAAAVSPKVPVANTRATPRASWSARTSAARKPIAATLPYSALLLKGPT